MSLNEYLDTQEQVNDTGFTVKDDSTANWALRKIAEYKSKQAEVNALAAAEMDKIEQWANAENERHQRQIDYFTSLLSVYAMKKKEKDPKFKSMNLPNGRLQFRKQQPKWEYDESALLETLKKEGMSDFIKVKESPDKDAIKKAFEVHEGKAICPDTGQVIKGITVTEQGETFGVVTNE